MAQNRKLRKKDVSFGILRFPPTTKNNKCSLDLHIACKKAAPPDPKKNEKGSLRVIFSRLPRYRSLSADILMGTSHLNHYVLMRIGQGLLNIQNLSLTTEEPKFPLWAVHRRMSCAMGVIFMCTRRKSSVIPRRMRDVKESIFLECTF